MNSADSAHSDTGTTTLLRPEDLGFGPLFWAARDAVIIGDAKYNRILFWNPAAERLFGYTAKEVVGRSVDMLVPEHLRGDMRARINAFADLGEHKYADPTAPIEQRAIRKSGEEIIVEFTLSPLNLPGESYAFGLIRDITERKRLEAERDVLLADAQETLRQANKLSTLKSDFTAMIAHEAGSPVAAIAGMVDLLERDGLPEDKRQRISSTIRSEIHALQRLIEDVQSASVMERGRFAVQLQPTPLNSLLDNAMTSARSHLSGHDFRLEPDGNVMVLTDPERISQVLRNLLGNAAKHTPPGTPVTLRASHDNERVHIEVIDEGPGIPPQDLEHIFSKFGRGRDATGKRLPGMGLGLYLSRRIVQDHGGTLFATSAPGKGTTFSFDLQEAPQ